MKKSKSKIIVSQKIIELYWHQKNIDENWLYSSKYMYNQLLNIYDNSKEKWKLLLELMQILYYDEIKYINKYTKNILEKRT